MSRQHLTATYKSKDDLIRLLQLIEVTLTPTGFGVEMAKMNFPLFYNCVTSTGDLDMSEIYLEGAADYLVQELNRIVEEPPARSKVAVTVNITQVLLNLCHVQLRQGKADKAQETLERAYQFADMIDKDNARFRTLRLDSAEILQRHARPEEAID